MVKQISGPGENAKLSGFFVILHIRMMGYFRLGLVSYWSMNALHCPKFGLVGFESTTGAKENTKKPATSDSCLDAKYPSTFTDRHQNTV